MIIIIDENGNAYSSIHGAHDVHNDGAGHSGIFATMGTDIMSISKRLGLVTNRSTKIETVSNG